MNEAGFLMVAELCEAIAEYAEAAPKAAIKTARRMAQQLRATVDRAAERGFQLDELRAKRGTRSY